MTPGVGSPYSKTYSDFGSLRDFVTTLKVCLTVSIKLKKVGVRVPDVFIRTGNGEELILEFVRDGIVRSSGDRGVRNELKGVSSIRRVWGWHVYVM